LKTGEKKKEKKKEKKEGRVYRLKIRLGADVNQGGENVSKSLSGASLCDTDHVLAQQGHRPSLALNGCRLLESHTCKLVKNELCNSNKKWEVSGNQIIIRRRRERERERGIVTGEGGLREGSDRTRDVGSDDGHLVLLAEVDDVLFTAPRNRLGLVVEGLGHLSQVELIPG